MWLRWLPPCLGADVYIDHRPQKHNRRRPFELGFAMLIARHAASNSDETSVSGLLDES